MCSIPARSRAQITAGAPRLTEHQRLLLADLQKNGPQMSWDWDADYRFAEILGGAEVSGALYDALHSNATTYTRLKVVRAAGVTKKRLRALRQLVALGLARSYWVGSDEGGQAYYGVNRFRAYEAVDGAPA